MTTHVLHRQLGRSWPIAVSGAGCTLTDSEGRTYLDASGGAAVSCLGHAHPDVIAAMHAQIDRLAYAHTSFFTTEVAEELADDLIQHAPRGMSHAYFVSGGSEAIEAALKMARQYFVETGQPQRRHFIARRQSYHGNTLGALAVGGNEWRRRQFAPLLIPATHVSPCYEYRDREHNETPEAYGARLVHELDAAIDKPRRRPGDRVRRRNGGRRHRRCADAGARLPHGVREVCDRHGVLLILDEVMCGMGRTGTLHACEQEGVVPDLLVIAKGLGGGYQPIGAVLAQARLVDAIARGSGLFQHGHTYIGHAVACAAALAVQQVIRARRPARARATPRRGSAPAPASGLRRTPARGRHPRARAVPGIELVQDRTTQGDRSIRRSSCMPASRRRRWHAG